MEAEGCDQSTKEGVARIKLPRSLLSAEGQYEQAITVDCPFCGAKKGSRCKESLIFPQYPCTSRIEASLQLPKGSWENATFDWFEN